MKIAILGADGTGRAELSHALCNAQAVPPAAFTLTDTTALLTALDNALLLDTLHHQHAAMAPLQGGNLILVTGLDWPWLAGCNDRDGLLKRSRVDSRLRQLLQAAALNYVVIYGNAAARIDCALQAIAHHAGLPQRTPRPTSPWQWNCEKCSDSACEHRMFTGLIKLNAA